MTIKEIVASIDGGQVRVTDHADEEARADIITLGDIFAAVRHGEIIEDYPDDKPYPSCLIYGQGPDREPIHSVWAYNRENGWAVLITVYRPDPGRWIEWRVRRRKDDAV